MTLLTHAMHLQEDRNKELNSQKWTSIFFPDKWGGRFVKFAISSSFSFINLTDYICSMHWF